MSSTGFKLQSRHDFVMDKVPRETTQKSIKARVWFLRSARRLMFCEDSLNGFQVIEQTRFCDRVQGQQLKKYKFKSFDSYALHVV